MATLTVEAVFQHGVFRPLTPVSLPEDSCVTLVLYPEEPQRRLMFGEMDESEMAWVGWAGSLGEPDRLLGLEQDEG